jgi:CBS domain-containing protein
MPVACTGGSLEGEGMPTGKGDEDVNTSVKDVMTSRVIWVEKDTPFAAIAAALRQYQVSAFPVLNPAGQVIGVVSEADLLAKLSLESGEGYTPGMISGILHQQQLRKARATTAGDLMTTLPVTCSPDDTVEHAAWLMHQRKVKHLPVVDASDHLVGIISRADVLSVYSRLDEDIREEVMADVALSTSPADSIDVSVHDGIVTLTGKADSGGLRVVAGRVRHIEGVVAVRDWVSYPPPEPGSFDVIARFPTD